MTERKRDYEQATRRILTGICTIAAIAASFIFLTGVAIENGWPKWAAWLLPLCVDALIGMALMRSGIVAALVAVGAIAVSFAGNGLSHLYATDTWQPTMWSIALIGGIPALSLGLCRYLSRRKETADGAATTDSDGGAVDAGVDSHSAGVDGRRRTANTSGPGDSGTGSDRPHPRRRATKTAARRGTGSGRGPTGPDVETVAVDIRRLGINSKRQAKQHFGIGDDKVNSEVVVAALTANRNGH